MADVKREIEFHKSMVADKRNPDFAYLINNKMETPVKGLYPAVSFYKNTEINSGNIIDIVRTSGPELNNPQPYIYVRDGSTTRVYQMIDGTEWTTFSNQIRAMVFGSDGLYICDNASDIYEQGVGGGLFKLAEVTGDVYLGGWDGVYYWWLGENFSRQLPTSSTVEIGMTVSSAFAQRMIFMDFFDDDMIIYSENTEQTNLSIQSETEIYIWDKSNTTFFKKRIVFKNEKLIAGGVINNIPMLVTSAMHSGNLKEAFGYLKIYKYNGEKFVEVNRIKTGKKSVSRKLSTLNSLPSSTCKTNQHYMIFSVADNNQIPTDDLSQNFIFKLFEDGSIQILTIPVPNGSVSNANVVATFQNADVYGINAGGSDKTSVYWNHNQNNFSNSDYSLYNGTTYITNFYTNPANRHGLDCFSVTFEKLFNAEELEVYYRTSTKEDWALLGTIDKAKVIANVNKRIDQSGDTPLPEQIYQFKKMPDGTALPEFNEIQFKFISKKGFSVIGCWFDYNYITRNTKK